jgi:hypothetical protein
MDLANSFIAVRFAMSVLLAFGGIACIGSGYRLLRDRSGLATATDKIDWTSKQTKTSAARMSVGSVLMLTSVGRARFPTIQFLHFNWLCAARCAARSPGAPFSLACRRVGDDSTQQGSSSR